MPQNAGHNNSPAQGQLLDEVAFSALHTGCMPAGLQHEGNEQGAEEAAL